MCSSDLWQRIRGIDSTAVVTGEARKSVSSERTFAKDLTDDETLERELLRLCVSSTAHLRADDLRARTVTVKLRDADFTTRSSSHTLTDPVETDQAVYAVAVSLLRELRKKRRCPARLLGVGLSGLTPADAPSQLALFGEDDPVESDRARTIARVVDDLRERFGRSAVLPGRVLEP